MLRLLFETRELSPVETVLVWLARILLLAAAVGFPMAIAAAFVPALPDWFVPVGMAAFFLGSVIGGVLAFLLDWYILPEQPGFPGFDRGPGSGPGEGPGKYR